MKQLRIFFKELNRSLHNLKYYFKVIWEDRQWDHQYMEDLMLAKFEKWYKVYSSDNVPFPYEGIEKDVQAMRICINILKRRKEGWYTNVWYSKYAFREETIWEEIPEGDNTYNIFKEDNPTNQKLFEMKSKGLTEEESKKSHEWLINCNKVEERDWIIFCDILKKYNNKWWD
jgi:hypothetical protein